MYLRVLFDPLYEETVTNFPEIMVYMVRHFFIELVFTMSIFAGLMLKLLLIGIGYLFQGLIIIELTVSRKFKRIYLTK